MKSLFSRKNGVFSFEEGMFKKFDIEHFVNDNIFKAAMKIR